MSVKHNAKSFYEGQQPLLRKELNEKASINNNDKIQGDIENKERPIKQKRVNSTDKSGQEEIIKIDEEQIKEDISVNPLPQILALPKGKVFTYLEGHIAIITFHNINSTNK